MGRDSVLFLERYRGWVAPLANSKQAQIIDGAETVLQSGETRLIESGEFLTFQLSFCPIQVQLDNRRETNYQPGGESNRMQKKEKASARAPVAASIPPHAASIAVAHRNTSGRRDID